jgi:hypothetical protein
MQKSLGVGSTGPYEYGDHTDIEVACHDAVVRFKIPGLEIFRMSVIEAMKLIQDLFKFYDSPPTPR